MVMRYNLFCIHLRVWYSKIFPSGYGKECKELLKLAWPIIITQILFETTLSVSLAFSGHLGRESLDGVALATTIINVSCLAVLEGLSSACDTLFSQTFGSKNQKKVGIIAQRSALVMMLACIPCIAIFLNAEYLIRLMGESNNVARLGGKYAQMYILSIPADGLVLILETYLQAQSIVIPSLVILVVCNLLNACFHGIFLYGLHMDISGAALSVAITNWCIVGLHLLYIYKSGIYKATWTGWSRESVLEWKSFLKLAIPSTLMICLEWWSFEVIVYISAKLGETPLAANVINYDLASLLFMIPYGISEAVTVRVGNFLGANKPLRAKTSSNVAITIAWIVGCINAIFLLSLKDYIPKIFSDESDVISLASIIMPQLALYCFFDFTQGTAQGVIRGVGHQKFGAITNLIAYYLIAYPVALPLMLLTPLGVIGAWWGMTLSVAVQTFLFLWRIGVLNWTDEANIAQDRAGVTDDFQSYVADVFTITGSSSLKEIELDTKEQITEQNTPDADNVTKPKSSKQTESNSFVNYTDFKKAVRTRLLILLGLLCILFAGVACRIYLETNTPWTYDFKNSTIGV